MSTIVMVDAFLTKLSVFSVKVERRGFNRFGSLVLNRKSANHFTEDDLYLHLFPVKRFDCLIDSLIDLLEPLVHST